MNHIEVSPDQGRAFFSQPDDGPVLMLNLLRFRETADYSRDPKLAPEAPISGREAYARYKSEAKRFLAAAGSELVFSGRGGPFLIGPNALHWDEVLIVKHSSRSSFLAFAKDEGYHAILGHRMAALEDSRLMPMVDSVV